jgi:hypothetical protein
MVSFIYEVPRANHHDSRAVYLTEGDSLLVNKCAVETIFIEAPISTGIPGMILGFRRTRTVPYLSVSLRNRVNFNFSIYFRQSDLLYTLPCSWNLQLSDNSLSGIQPLHNNYSNLLFWRV